MPPANLKNRTKKETVKLIKYFCFQNPLLQVSRKKTAIVHLNLETSKFDHRVTYQTDQTLFAPNPRLHPPKLKHRADINQILAIRSIKLAPNRHPAANLLSNFRSYVGRSRVGGASLIGFLRRRPDRDEVSFENLTVKSNLRARATHRARDGDSVSSLLHRPSFVSP